MKIIITENQLKFLLEEEIKGVDEVEGRCEGDPNSKNPCMSFEDARNFIHSIPDYEKPTTGKDFSLWLKNNIGKYKNLKSIPKTPAEFYKKRGKWEGWNDFLGLKEKEYLNYEDAQKCVISVINDIKEVPFLRKFSEWKNKYKDKYPCLYQIKDDVAYHYKKELSDKGLNFNFTEFIGQQYWSYEVAKKRIQEIIKNLPKEEIPNSKTYKKWYKKYKNKIGYEDLNFIPSSPDDVYSKHGKVKGVFSWKDFLSIEEFFTYEEAKNYLQSLNIPYDEKPRGRREFKIWYDKNVNKDGFELLKRIPINPYDYYKSRNIKIDWEDFMGVEETNYSIGKQEKFIKDKNNWLKFLFKKDIFNKIHSFSKKDWDNLSDNEKQKIKFLSDDREKSYKDIIPNGTIPRYFYDKVKYKSSNFDKILIGCKIHNDIDFQGSPIKGYFLQIPNSHLLGNGCPICAKGDSIGEKLIRYYLEKLKIDFNPSHKLNYVPGCIGGKRNCDLKHDFKLLGEYENIYIEFDGQYHFMPHFTEKKYVIDSFLGTVYRDNQRNQFFNSSDKYKLIRISYKSMKNIKNILTEEFLDKVKNSKGVNIFSFPHPYTPIDPNFQKLVKNKLNIPLYGNGTILDPNKSL